LQRHEWLAVELEGAGYNGSLASRPGVFEALQAEDFGVLHPPDKYYKRARDSAAS
jgi:hypothetical protein